MILFRLVSKVRVICQGPRMKKMFPYREWMDVSGCYALVMVSEVNMIKRRVAGQIVLLAFAIHRTGTTGIF